MSTTESLSLDGAAIDAILEGAARGDAVPGVAVIVSSRDGVLYEGYAGRLRDWDDDAPAVGEQTLLRMASMTKAMATVAVLQLVEEGAIALDTPIQDVIPAFGELQVLDGFDGDTPILRAPARPVTLTDLLTHTSGLAYFFLSDDLLRWHGATETPTVLAGAKAGLMTPLAFDPGTTWQYGINTDWVGQVVEALRGQTLDVVLQERVFEPLGMADATFRPTDAQRERLMSIHQRQADGSLAPSEVDLVPDPEFAAGGHGSFMTARDHSRFLRALLRGGELDGARILKPETVDLMFTDHIEGIPIPELMRSNVPALCNDVPSLPIRQGWGLGLHLAHEAIPGMRAAGSGDWAGLFNSYYWLDRETGVTVALITQVLPFFDHEVVPVLLGVEQAVYAGLAA